MDVCLDAVFYFGGGVLLLATVLWLSATVYLYLVHRRYDHIPRPPMPSFYFGHIPAFSKMTKAKDRLGDIFLKWGQECGPFYVIFFMHVPAVVAFKPEDIKEVLMNIRVPKSAKGYKIVAETFGQRFLGRGLITLLDFDSWRPRRSLYDPTFTKSYLKSLIPAFNGCVDHFLEWLKIQATRKRTVPMRKELGAITLQILGKVAFGSDFSQPWTDRELGLRHVKGDGTLGFLIEHSFEAVETMSRNPLHYLFHPFSTEGYRETIRAMRKIGQDCIVQRFKAIADKEEVPNDILTQIVRVASSDAGRGVDMEDLVDDFVSFYIAGQETTALMLTFTLIELSQHPEVRQRVLDEIFEVLGDRKFVTAEDIEQLQYMEQVFLEVLRLYPPAVGTSRESPSDDFYLSGYSIPKGTTIMLSFYANHRNPDHWDDPETFDPNRFSPARGKPSPFIYSPFSSGHRSCIGKVFAMMEGKIILSRLLSSFQVTLQEGYQLKVEQTTTLRPVDYVPCKLVPLN